MGKSPHPDEYFVGAYFKVEIDGVAVADFREADGLTVHREVVEYQEGGENSKTHKLLGPTRWSNIVLRRGVSSSVDFWTWMKKTIDAQEIERKNGAIIAVNQKGEPKARWDFVGGWPCRYEGPRMDSLDSEIKIELIEIAHDGFTFKKS